ncbi:class I SAM-dependent methyltransferase [Terracoccus luteus]|uniref:Methyltransferase family protein n=1 Tax=Terracoccus luteus TaxID=53356 RepID=A0A495XWL7_9MICO|nr:class I SAM-dependent methyltransferase [Terracoccus luteus]MBB2986220.1 SAM-dependent methyltransferase [Terracoccus luteus]MCP2172190.1 SAM-dependent methyltransferase [Terracoccus luteus]RKT78971.1 methyltransferase family protein [Terracoccus luteus]
MSEVIPSPNIWHTPDVYEVENRGVDRAGVIDAAMRSVLDWSGLDVVDIGCGTGYHLPVFARDARSVVGVEPHPPLASLAAERVSGMPSCSVREEGAAAIGVPDASFDVAHARWAYFFGPGCEPGLAELDRVMRPGGAAFVVDNDATRSTFGRWFRRALPGYDPRAVERFWERQGWSRERLDIAWTFDSRDDFEAVVGIEFAPEHADLILAEHPDATGVDYAVNLWHRRY